MFITSCRIRFPAFSCLTSAYSALYRILDPARLVFSWSRFACSTQENNNLLSSFFVGFRRFPSAGLPVSRFLFDESTNMMSNVASNDKILSGYEKILLRYVLSDSRSICACEVALPNTGLMTLILLQHWFSSRRSSFHRFCMAFSSLSRISVVEPSITVGFSS